MKARTLVLGNGVAGAEKQALALAEKIALPFSLHRNLPRRGALLVPTPATLALSQLPFGQRLLGLEEFTPPHPAVAVSCGRASIPASTALRAASRGRTLTVHVQRPACSESCFDLVVAPRHDYDGVGSLPENVPLTEGALHGVSPHTLRSSRVEWAAELQPLPAPRIALLVGGLVSRRWWQRPLAPDLTADAARELVRSALAAADESSGSLLVATSRRTPDAARAAIDDELQRRRHGQAALVADAFGSGGGEDEHAGGVPHRLWQPDAVPNPFGGLLAWADYLLVTSDSINMVSEACGTGKCVYVWRARECSRRFLAFHERLLETGRAREWRGELEPPSSWPACHEGGDDDTARAAARVLQMLADRNVVSAEP